MTIDKLDGPAEDEENNKPEIDKPSIEIYEYFMSCDTYLMEIVMTVR